MTMTISGSGTIGGLVAGGLPDDSVITADILNANITQDKLATAVIPLGAGQTWQNVTGSRTTGTTYTNSTGRPIAVYVRWIGSGSTVGQFDFYINGVNTSYILFYTPTASYVSPHFFIIPAGATYSYSAYYGGIAGWWELR